MNRAALATPWMVAWVGPGLGLATYGLLDLPVDGGVLALLAAGAFLVYALDRALPFSPEDDAELPCPFPVIAALLAAVLVVAAAAGLILSEPARWVLCGLGILSLVYVVPVLPGRRRAKDLPLLKVPLVAGGWTLAAVLLPIVQGGSQPGPAAGWLLLYRTLFLAPNLILADWPDRDRDRRAGIVTPANCLSPRAIRRLCVGVALLAAGVAALGAGCTILPWWIGIDAAGLGGLLGFGLRRLPSDRRMVKLVLDGLAGWPGWVALGMWCLAH